VKRISTALSFVVAMKMNSCVLQELNVYFRIAPVTDKLNVRMVQMKLTLFVAQTDLTSTLIYAVEEIYMAQNYVDVMIMNSCVLLEINV
jgi:hypothetical protein